MSGGDFLGYVMCKELTAIFLSLLDELLNTTQDVTKRLQMILFRLETMRRLRNQLIHHATAQTLGVILLLF